MFYSEKPENFIKKIALLFFCVISFAGCTSGFISLTMPSGDKIKAKPAVAADEFAKGLSGIDRLDGYDAMFFMKDKAERVCFWMKDMRFPLDIIYLDEKKQAQEIFPNLTPCLDGQECAPYCSHSDSIKYILEIPAGASEKYAIQPNSMIK
ncbi:MAG: DUF192 domain-containing protein [Parcubacteria group bacterium]